MKSKAVWVKPEIQQAFETKIRETIEKARQFCTVELIVPTVVFRRLGAPAGVCRHDRDNHTAIVFINPDYFEQDYDFLLNRTCPHEVAHYITDRMHPKAKAHGVEWQTVMRKLGLIPDRCHTLDSSKTKLRTVPKPFKYSCGCPNKEFLLSFHKHNRHQTRKYFCKRCKSILTYEGMFKDGKFMTKIQRTLKAVVANEVEILPITTVKPKPVVPPSTHRIATRLVNGVLTNVRIPITV